MMSESHGYPLSKRKATAAAATINPGPTLYVMVLTMPCGVADDNLGIESVKVLNQVGRIFAHRNSCSEKLISPFQPGRRVNGVAMGRVIKHKFATKIAHRCRSGINPNSGDANFSAVLLHLGSK